MARKLGQLDLALAQLAEAEEKQKRTGEEKQILQQEVYRFADHRHRKDGYAQTHERIWTGSHRLSEIIWRI